MKENILGYEVNSDSVDDCVNAIEYKLIASKQASSRCDCLWLACFNPHSYVMAIDDPVFSKALQSADWLLPDGAGVLLASRILAGGIKERITGSDVFSGLHARLNIIGGFSVFFLGASEDTLSLIRQKMSVDYPNIRVAGTFSPPYKPEYSVAELDEMINAINGSNADILWVGMTAPKQEKWIEQNKQRLNVHFAAAVGAVFDFYTGKVKRSHPIFQRLGLEWLPRLLQEPRRLWRRMGISAPIFVFHTLFWRFRK